MMRSQSYRMLKSVGAVTGFSYDTVIAEIEVLQAQKAPPLIGWPIRLPVLGVALMWKP
jgi:hypothetical protein